MTSPDPIVKLREEPEPSMWEHPKPITLANSPRETRLADAVSVA